MTDARMPWTFVTPALFVLVVFFGLPVVAALLLSFTDFDLYALADIRNLRFVGLDNYADVLAAPLFWKALANTVYFVLVGVPLSIGVSLGAALLLHSPLARFKSFFRTALFAPVVTTVVAVAIIFRYLFHTRYGLINHALGRQLHLVGDAFPFGHLRRRLDPLELLAERLRELVVREPRE